MHHGRDDSPEDFEMGMDIDHRVRTFGALGGRIILLQDGSGITPESLSEDSEMLIDDEEDRDLEVQVVKATPDGSDEEDDDEQRGVREGTPGPTGLKGDRVEELDDTDDEVDGQTEGAAHKVDVQEVQAASKEGNAATSAASSAASDATPLKPPPTDASLTTSKPTMSSSSVEAGGETAR